MRFQTTPSRTERGKPRITSSGSQCTGSIGGRFGEYALRRHRERYHHRGHRTRAIRRCRSQSGSSESKPSAGVSPTPSGCNATPNPSRTGAPTRRQSASCTHSRTEARLPGHMAKGPLKQLVLLGERCPGRSAGSDLLPKWVSSRHRRRVPLTSPLERIRLPRAVISGCPSPLGALRCPSPLATLPA